jgi:hypothetical protein
MRATRDRIEVSLRDSAQARPPVMDIFHDEPNAGLEAMVAGSLAAVLGDRSCHLTTFIPPSE